MNQPPQQKKEVFATPWFQVLATQPDDGTHPHYAIQAPDFVVIVALDVQDRLVLVRQFRPAVEEMTLELPAGHIEPDETSEQAARKELLEETGYEADEFTLVAKFSPSTARFTNKMWCFFAGNARPSPRAAAHREIGMDLVLYDRGVGALIDEKEFFSAGSCAALFAAVIRGKLKL